MVERVNYLVTNAYADLGLVMMKFLFNFTLLFFKKKVLSNILHV